MRTARIIKPGNQYGFRVGITLHKPKFREIGVQGLPGCSQHIPGFLVGIIGIGPPARRRLRRIELFGGIVQQHPAFESKGSAAGDPTFIGSCPGIGKKACRSVEVCEDLGDTVGGFGAAHFQVFIQLLDVEHKRNTPVAGNELKILPCPQEECLPFQGILLRSSQRTASHVAQEDIDIPDLVIGPVIDGVQRKLPVHSALRASCFV